MRTAPTSERGSIPLALLAVIMVGGALVLLTSSSMAGHRTARSDRSYSTALHVADAGTQDILFRLNIANPVGSTLAATGSVEGGTYSASAQRVAPRQWDVESTATVGTTTRTVHVRLSEDRRFFASAFADGDITFNGGNTADTYNSGDAGGSPYTPRPGRLGTVGSNGNMRFLGTSSTVDGIHVWNFAPPNDDLATRCNGNATIGLAPTLQACAPEAFTTPAANPYSMTDPYRRMISPTVEALQSKIDACGPNITGDLTINNASQATLRPATTTQTTGAHRSVAPSADGEPGYRCYRNVTFSVDTQVADASLDNPVIIYVTGDVTMNGTGRRVNCSTCTNKGDSHPSAGRLQLYTPGTGSFNGAQHAKFGGTFYGPRASCGGGAQAEIYGALICGTIGNVGGWSFHYDAALERYGNSIFEQSWWSER